MSGSHGKMTVMGLQMKIRFLKLARTPIKFHFSGKKQDLIRKPRPWAHTPIKFQAHEGLQYISESLEMEHL